MKAYKKNLLLSLVIFIAGFFILDFPYFYFQINRVFIGHTYSYVFSVSTSAQQKENLPANTIKILSLNILAPIVYPPKLSDSYENYLKQGTVHFPGSALPGQYGNCFIFGHSSDLIWVNSGYKTVFAPLPGIAQGTSIFVSDASGQTFEYVVTKTLITGPNDVSVLDQQGNTKRLLTLQTSYPLGTALERFIVQAELQN